MPQLGGGIYGIPTRAHPELGETVFGQDARQNKQLGRRSASIGSKRALAKHHRRPTLGAGPAFTSGSSARRTERYRLWLDKTGIGTGFAFLFLRIGQVFGDGPAFHYRHRGRRPRFGGQGAVKAAILIMDGREPMAFEQKLRHRPPEGNYITEASKEGA